MPGLNPTDQDIAQFCEITGADQQQAHQFLEAGTTLEGAIEDYFAAQTAAEPGSFGTGPSPERDLDASSTGNVGMSDPNQDQPPPSGAPGRLGGAKTLSGKEAEPLPAGWGQPARARFGRIGDWGGGDDQPGAGPGDDDEEEEGPGGKKGEEFYTGGEKSGLAVQNPNQPGGSAPKGARGLVENILKQATGNSREREAAASSQSSNPFRGSGNTLGTDETPSTTIPDPSAQPPRAAAPGGGMMSDVLRGLMGGRGAPPEDEGEQEEAETRRLTFWRNGFSIEDGPLMEYDAPGNKELLEAIQSGRAPPSVFGVRYNQPISIEVSQRLSEEWSPPPKKPMKAFGGGGNRLGSPAPEVTGSGSATPSMPGGLPGSGSVRAPAAAGASQTGFELDESKPMTSVQVRLGDGTRLVAKVNLTHRVGDLRNFVSAARPDPRPFVLQTTFPSKELDNPNMTIEEAKLQNAVVVQRFT